MLERLGRDDRIVAIGDYVRRPERLLSLPRLGSYDAPDLERLVELRVDLLVTSYSHAARTAHDRIRALGIEVLALDTETYDGVFDSIERLGEALEARDAAGALVESIRSELCDVRRLTESTPRRSVLFVVGRDPLFVAGPGSHLDTLIRVAGGDNVAADLGDSYRRLSLEAALERRPEVIIDTSDNRPDALRGHTAGEWARWSFVPAVRDGRVWHVDPELLVIPGVRLPEMARLMARLIHPETLGAPTARELSGDARRSS
jgi:iron complex transport system substrate-binding protein